MDQTLDLRNLEKIESFSSQFARLGDMYILSQIDSAIPMGDAVESGFYDLMKPLRLNGLLLLTIDAGSSDMTVNTTKYNLTAGDMLVVRPGTLILFNSALTRTRLTLLFISTASLQSINIDFNSINLQPLLSNPHPVMRLEPGEKDVLRKYFELLILNAAGRTPSVFATKIAGSLIASITYEIFRFAMDRTADNSGYEKAEDAGQTTRVANYVHRFMQLLHVNYASQRNLSFYARELCITPKYLSMITKEITGLTASEWLNRVVILEAKNMLRFSDKNIQQVAYALNFPSQSAFGKYFKRFTGQSPRDYVKQL